MIQQLKFLWADYKRLSGRKLIRLLLVWTSRAGVGIALYRIERGLYLTFKRYYSVFRILLLPILLPLYAYANLDIHYEANIGPGIKVLHPATGVVISGYSIIGRNLTLTGGNTIGGRSSMKRGELIIGDNCYLGANACIIGPCVIGQHANIGAGAVVVRSAPDNVVLGGVPAKILKIKSDN